MKIEVLSFNELTLNKLYEILRLRSEVFVVEQTCAYQDVDGKDQKALHVLGWHGPTLVGYARCFAPGDYFDEAAIGRVVIKENFRKNNHGYHLMQAAIDATTTHFKVDSIRISAQTYLIDFYQNLGFHVIGESYLEDDIPHIGMIRP
jgi:ElaA protein